MVMCGIREVEIFRFCWLGRVGLHAIACWSCAVTRMGKRRHDDCSAHSKTKFCRRRSKINAFRGSTICTCRCESADPCAYVRLYVCMSVRHCHRATSAVGCCRTSPAHRYCISFQSCNILRLTSASCGVHFDWLTYITLRRWILLIIHNKHRELTQDAQCVL